MALNQLELSLQFGKFDNLAAHRALLTRSLVTRWIRHALAVDAEMTVRIVGTEPKKASSSTASTATRTTPPMC